MANDDQAVLEATSQLSRFHLDCIDPTSDVVDLKGVNVVVDGTNLLSDAHLQLKPGVRYGLIGRNGTGKSTLLRAIGTGMLVGFPNNITVMYVAQELAGDDRAVLDAVLDSNAVKTALNRDVEALEQALSSEPDELAAVLHRVKAAGLQQQAHDAEMIAKKRSGRRGLAARKVAVAANNQAGDFASQVLDTRPTEDIAAEAQTILTGLYEQLAGMDADADEARARVILTGLGFSSERQSATTKSLSGGWRMRAALACALFAAPKLLLLDEPTNHLDLEAMMWLREWLLAAADQTLLVVSHDRDFLNAVGEEIIVLTDKQLTYYDGNYDAYEEARSQAATSAARQVDALDRQRKHMEASVEALSRSARASGDDKKMSLAASRRKKMEERMGSNRTEDGKRFKLSYWAGWHDNKRPRVQLAKVEKEVTFELPEPEPLRYTGPVLQLREVSYRYRGAAAPVLQNVVMNVATNARIGLLGANASGKSTLLGLLSGQLAPTRGSIERFSRLKVAMFSQHHIQELGLQDSSSGAAVDAGAGSRSDGGVLGVLMKRYAGVHEQEGRNWLGSWGIHGSTATLPLLSLSGGQRARAALALELWPRPHILLLDEPTNHLDMQSIIGLSKALRAWQGGVVLVSHDVRFLGEVCEELWLVKGAAVKRYEGSAANYADRVLARVRRRQAAAAAAAH